MRTTRYILALLSATAVLSSCIEENFENTIKVNRGDDIVFGALAGFENNAPDTKTIYTGQYYYLDANGNASEEGANGARRFETVHWKANDKVLIHCDQGEQTAHYNVVTGDATGSALERMQLQGVANNAIQWNDITENDHNFYAVYPSPYQFSAPVEDNQLIAASDYQDRIKVNNGILECYLPASQAPTSISVIDGVTVAEPNMDIAYMIARNTVEANPDAKVPTSVELNFRPIVTALEITMTFPSLDGDHVYEQDGNEYQVTGYDDILISNVQISSRDNSPIVGSFSMDLNAYTHNQTTDGYPEVEFDATSIENSSVSVQMWDADGQPTRITSGGSLKFTVFLLPTVIENNLKISVIASGIFKSADLDIKIEAHKKQYINNIVLPATPQAEGIEITAQGSNWVSQLDPATYLGGLSIPATANSFSYAYPGGSGSSGDSATGNNIDEDSKAVRNNFMTQTISFENQWNLGVRCFELVTERYNSTTNTPDDTRNLGGQNLKCNGQSLGITVEEAFDKILAKVLASPGEFAMIIMTYQPEGGSGKASRDPVEYMYDLGLFYDKYEYEGKSLKELTCVYQPGLRVADLKNTPVMIVVRPSQEGEDDPDTVEQANAGSRNMLVVKGWGSLPDKWYKRGYLTKLYEGLGGDTGTELYTDNIHTDLPAMEEWIYGTRRYYSSGSFRDLDGERRTDSRPAKGTPRFDYVSDQGFNVWAQEWRRVHTDNTAVTDRYTEYAGGFLGWGARSDKWIPSYEEKQKDIEDCIIRAIASEANRVYFNSLDGFYITTAQNSYDQYWRGNEGNIGSYAQHINDWFYPVLQQYSAADVTGPLGVIIMDRVSNEQGSAGQLLPQTIIQNNFMFNVPKDPSLSVINGGDAI